MAADIRDIDPVTGLCAFHTTNGPATIRPSDKEMPWKRPSISAVKEAPPPETDDEDDEEALDQPEAADEETLAAQALFAKEHFTERRLLIMKALADELDRTAIARLVKTNTNTLNGSIRNAALALGIDSSIVRGRKGAYFAEVLIQLCRYMEKEGFAFPKQASESPGLITLNDEDIACRAAMMGVKFNLRRRQIMQHLLDGRERIVIAKSMNSTINNIISTILTMGRVLDIPMEHVPGSKIDYVTSVLVRIAKHPRAGFPE